MKRKKELGTRNIIGAAVTKLRIQRHMSQKELAAYMQEKGVAMNDSSLSKLEGQTRIATDRELLALADIFQVSPEELLGFHS